MRRVVIQKAPEPETPTMHLLVKNDKFSTVMTTREKLEELMKEAVYVGQITQDAIQNIFGFNSPQLVKPHQVAERANEWGLQNVPVLQQSLQYKQK